MTNLHLLSSARCLAAMSAAVLTLSCTGSCQKEDPAETSNEAKYITDSSKLKMIRSMKNLDGIGGFYELNYTADYKMDKCVNTYQAITLDDLSAFTAKELYDVPVTKAIDIDYGSGCSAFAAKTPDGKCLMGRNFDFAHPADIAAVMVRTAPKNGYKSICMVDAYWIGYERGFYNDGVTDISNVMLLPYVLMDGMNEKGFAVGVLHLDGEPTMQNTGKKKIATSTAMRYLLDTAEDVEDAIDKLSEFDMNCTFNDAGNYHFFIADAAGNSAVVEYVYVGDEKNPNTFDPLVGERYVTNFYVSPKMANHKYGGLSDHGRNRYNILADSLAVHNNIVTETQAMTILYKASQPKDPKVLTSNTQWSVVYNLTDLTAKVCMYMDYDKTWAFDLEK